MAAASSLVKYSSPLVSVYLVHSIAICIGRKQVSGFVGKAPNRVCRRSAWFGKNGYRRPSRRRQEVKAAEKGARPLPLGVKAVLGLMLRPPFASRRGYGSDCVRFCEFGTALLTAAFCDEVGRVEVRE